MTSEQMLDEIRARDDVIVVEAKGDEMGWRVSIGAKDWVLRSWDAPTLNEATRRAWAKEPCDF